VSAGPVYRCRYRYFSPAFLESKPADGLVTSVPLFEFFERDLSRNGALFGRPVGRYIVYKTDTSPTIATPPLDRGITVSKKYPSLNLKQKGKKNGRHFELNPGVAYRIIQYIQSNLYIHNLFYDQTF
jgi:hypothetical protein